MRGSGPEESAPPQDRHHKQGESEAGWGGGPTAVPGVFGWIIAAAARAAGDVEASQLEDFDHVGALAPGGGCTASEHVVWGPWLMAARSFQTLVHGAAAVDEGGLLHRAPVGAVPLTAVALQFIHGQILKLQDWAPIAFGGVATVQEVEGVVVVEAGGAWATRKVATATDVVFISWASFQVPVGHHVHALLCRAAALQVLGPAPLTAEVR